jgi:hypothetical protein
MYSLAIFGSQQRGDNDSFSDHDFLIVGEKSSKAELLIKFAKSGRNLSFFSYKQMEAMKAVGSLFLQHLKFESRIIYDDSNWLGKFLEKCPFISPNEAEIDSALSNFNVLNIIPFKPSLTGWFADFLYVFSRDTFIKMAARERKLIFSPEKICLWLESSMGLTNSEASIFLDLRKEKQIFRSQGKSVLKLESITRWIRLLNSLFKANVEISQKDQNDFLHEVKKFSFVSEYQYSKILDACLILFSEEVQDFPSLKKIIELIKSPNHYPSKIHENKEKLDLLFKFLLKKHAIKK